MRFVGSLVAFLFRAHELGDVLRRLRPLDVRRQREDLVFEFHDATAVLGDLFRLVVGEVSLLLFRE